MNNESDQSVDGEAQERKHPRTTDVAHAGFRVVAEALGKLIGRFLHDSEQKQLSRSYRNK